MQPWVWLIIIIVIILVVWWLFTRSAQQHEADVDVHQVEETHPPAAEAVEEVEAIVQEEPPEPDDLASLEGIGPKVNSILQAAGITTFTQLAAAEVSRLEEILDANSLQFMDPSSWSEQAKLAAEGKIEELQALQDKLKGGRQVE